MYDQQEFGAMNNEHCSLLCIVNSIMFSTAQCNNSDWSNVLKDVP